MTTRAALTRPKSAGDSRRVSTTSTRIRSRHTAPVPQATQAMFPTACRARPRLPVAPSAGCCDMLAGDALPGRHRPVLGIVAVATQVVGQELVEEGLLCGR